MLKVCVIGASGIAAGEVIRLLRKHPEIEFHSLIANTSAGLNLLEFHPDLFSYTLESLDYDKVNSADVVFIGVPHATSADIISKINKPKVIDLGADFRLERKEDWEKFYQTPYSGSWVYGLPELSLADGGSEKTRELIKNSDRVAVAGCNVTAITLGIQPFINLIDSQNIQAVLANGYSGAGNSLKPNLLAINAFDNVKPYQTGGVHRHLPEIRQNLAKAKGISNFDDVLITFIPTLVPVNRGILASVILKPYNKISTAEVLQHLKHFYKNEQFVKVIDNYDELQLKSVQNTNNVHISVKTDQISNSIIVGVVIDNLVKGTAGQAIQVMNLQFGFDESLGLI